MSGTVVVSDTAGGGGGGAARSRPALLTRRHPFGTMTGGAQVLRLMP